MVRSLESARRLYPTQIQCYPEKSASPDKTSLFSIDTQICGEPPGLALRIQEILSVPSHQGHLLYCNPSAPRKTLGEPPLTMLICLHVPQKELARLINRCEGLSSQEICFFIQLYVWLVQNRFLYRSLRIWDQLGPDHHKVA